MFFKPASLKLEDCAVHDLRSELFLVEGDSAAASVAAIRNPQTQAVLPMQGKPLNALKASPKKVQENALYKKLSEVLGVSMVDEMKQPSLDFDQRLNTLRYAKVILLFDPDADGIHCGALMQLFFYRWMRPLIEAGRVDIVRFSLDDIKAYRPRGLGSLNPSSLREGCLAPETRYTRTISQADVLAAISIFGK
jgi:DNA gyrase subunit B